MAGTCLYIGLFVSNFLFLFQLIGAINLLLICGKMKYYQCHMQRISQNIIEFHPPGIIVTSELHFLLAMSMLASV